MSNLSDLYTNLKTRLAVILPSHRYLSDASIIARNTEQALIQGYGLQIGPGVNGEIELGRCSIQIDREIIVTLARKHSALELDRDAKYTVEQALLDDQLLVLKEFETDPTVSYSLSGNIANFKFIGDDGIEFVFSEDKNNFLMIRSRFNLKYYEQLP